MVTKQTKAILLSAIVLFAFAGQSSSLEFQQCFQPCYSTCRLVVGTFLCKLTCYAACSPFGDSSIGTGPDICIHKCAGDSCLQLDPVGPDMPACLDDCSKKCSN